MFGGIGTSGKLTLDCRFDEDVRVGHEGVEVIDAVVEVVLDLVEVAVVGVGDLRRDITLGDPVYVLCRYIERSDDGIQGIVDAFHDLLIIPLYLDASALVASLP